MGQSRDGSDKPNDPKPAFSPGVMRLGGWRRWRPLWMLAMVPLWLMACSTTPPTDAPPSQPNARAPRASVGAAQPVIPPQTAFVEAPEPTQRLLLLPFEQIQPAPPAAADPENPPPPPPAARKDPSLLGTLTALLRERGLAVDTPNGAAPMRLDPSRYNDARRLKQAQVAYVLQGRYAAKNDGFLSIELFAPPSSDPAWSISLPLGQALSVEKALGQAMARLNRKLPLQQLQVILNLNDTQPVYAQADPPTPQSAIRNQADLTANLLESLLSEQGMESLSQPQTSPTITPPRADRDAPSRRKSFISIVWVGGFLDPERADQRMAELKQRGYRPYLHLRNDQQGRLWRFVCLRRFEERQEAMVMKRAFEEREHQPAFVTTIDADNPLSLVLSSKMMPPGSVSPPLAEMDAIFPSPGTEKTETSHTAALKPPPRPTPQTRPSTQEPGTHGRVERETLEQAVVERQTATRESTAQQAAPVAGPERPKTWLRSTVWAGSYLRQKKAISYAKRYREMGYKSFIETNQNRAGQTQWNVAVGRSASRSNADALLIRFTEQTGIPAFISTKRVPLIQPDTPPAQQADPRPRNLSSPASAATPRYRATVWVGHYSTHHETAEAIKALQARQHTPWLIAHRDKNGARTFKVAIGQFLSHDQQIAQQMATQLKNELLASGIRTAVVGIQALGTAPLR
ncbi:MAG: SPOR domain-containing protein [Magnetococcales bacterium]|nr:SPOR domain-containing protein [Magnetococcales bacterium]